MLLGARMIWFCSSQLLHHSWVLSCFVSRTICCFDHSMDTLRRFYCNHSCWLLMHYLSSIMYFLDTVVSNSHSRCFPITGLTKHEWPFYPDLGFWEPPHQTNRRPILGVNTILHLHEGHNWHLCHRLRAVWLTLWVNRKTSSNAAPGAATLDALPSPKTLPPTPVFDLEH